MDNYDSEYFYMMQTTMAGGKNFERIASKANKGKYLNKVQKQLHEDADDI